MIIAIIALLMTGIRRHELPNEFHEIVSTVVYIANVCIGRTQAAIRFRKRVSTYVEKQSPHPRYIVEHTGLPSIMFLSQGMMTLQDCIYRESI